METKEKVESLQVFSSDQNFQLAQRIGQALMKSNLVPKEYQNNLPNTLIALEIANRIGASPLMVMQHLNIIYGRPSWSSTFIIAAINNCGRFEPLQFKMDGEGMKRTCVAWTRDKKGNVLEGPAVSIEMAKSEGWLDKNGSKWKTMPELMLRYRAAAFFGRLYAPEITMGMQSAEEVADAITNIEATSRGQRFDDEEIQVAQEVVDRPEETSAVQQTEDKAEKFEHETPEPATKPSKDVIAKNGADSLFPPEKKNNVV